jgi:hypothetical protein
MDYLHIIPSKGLNGCFYLDMPLFKALKKLRSFSSKLPSIRLIEESPTKRLIIDIPDSRLRLIFDDLYQHLLLIEIDCLPHSTPFLPIMFQSQLHTDYSAILLHISACPYKQLQLSPTDTIEQYSGISALMTENQLAKLFVHKGTVMPLNTVREEVRVYEVRVLDKVVIRHATGKTEELRWGMFPETVVEVMGPPENVRYNKKEEFCYVYVAEGIEFWFDSEKPGVKKMVLHTNMMEDIMFNEFQRCNYVIYSEKGEINPLTKFEEIREMIEEKPVDIGIKRLSFGFKPSQYFKYPGIIFEVLSTDYISSITLTKQ